jgi:hypothetical protein
MKEHFTENKDIILWLEDGIVYGVYKKDCIIDLPAAKEIVRLRESISRGKAFPVLVDARNIGNGTKEAREYFASEEACREIKKAALIIDSNFSKFLVNLFLKVNKPKTPTKIFTDKTSAEKWIKKDSDETNQKSLLVALGHL